MPSDYQGDADLLDETGEIIQTVRVYLRKTQRGGLGEWGGSIDPSEHGPRDWNDMRKVRLDNGEVGEASLAEHNIASGGPFGSHQRGTLKGSGPAPF